jgi:hypothetical protein
MRLQGFVFGIRVNKSFYLEDKSGAIIDELLYNKDSEFGPSLFPTVQENNGIKRLYNEVTDDKFVITHSDFIFEYTAKCNFDEEFQKYLVSYKQQILNNVFKKFDVHYIARFGFIIKAIMEQSDPITTSVHDIIRQQHNGYVPDSYSLRYNVKEKKPITIKGITTEDFDNIIVTYDKANEDKPLMFSVDYQRYFKPELDKISDSQVSYDDFCKRAYKEYRSVYK